MGSRAHLSTPLGGEERRDLDTEPEFVASTESLEKCCERVVAIIVLVVEEQAYEPQSGVCQLIPPQFQLFRR